MADRQSNTEARFWAKVDRSGECWVWTGYRDAGGYGRFRFKGAPKRAHRVLWLLTNGAIPDGLHVLHSCDNPPCVNPAHLRLGTNNDNRADMVSKGRQACGDRHMSRTRPECVARGERHPSRTHPEKLARGEAVGGAKLTADDVREIRRRAAAETQLAIGRAFGISRSNVSDIIHRVTWAHVVDAELEEAARLAEGGTDGE